MPDVNGSHFHLLLSHRDWFGPGLRGAGPSPVVDGDEGEASLEWSVDRGLHLRRFVPFERSAQPPRLDRGDRRGADRDRYGTWWVVGDDRRSLTGSRDGRVTQAWPPPACAPGGGIFSPAGSDEPRRPLRLGGVAVTHEHRLVVGVLDEPGLLVYDLVTGGEPSQLRWSGPAPFRPVELTRRRGGGVLVLDAGPRRASPARVWPLDRAMRPALVEPVDAGPVFVEPCDPRDATPPREAGRPVPWRLPDGRPTAIESLRDGSFLVLDEGAGVIRQHAGDRAGTGPADGAAVLATLKLASALRGRVEDGADARVLAHDIAVTEPADGPAQVFVSDRSGVQVFVFDLDEDGFAPRADDYPLRRHRGRALVAGGGEVYFDAAGGWFPLVPRSRPQHAVLGVLETGAFDGDEEGCRWHRVLLDGCLPAGTSVEVESRAHDDPAALPHEAWRREPRPYRRRAGADPGDAHGTWETLLQRTDGRYSQLRLTLRGRPTASPRIHALRLVFPRFSYLHEYLPAVYVDRDRPTRFLERFLANPEGLLTELEERVVRAHHLHDARTVPAEHLDWLAGWLGWTFEQDLDADRRRLFLEHAAALLPRRGTPEGIRRMLGLVLSDCPEQVLSGSRHQPFGIRVVEAFSTRRLGTRVPGGPGKAAGLGGPARSAQRWEPALGATELHRRFRDFLGRRWGGDWSAGPAWLAGRSREAVTVPPAIPADPVAATDWRDFLARQLGVREPAFGPEQAATYRRYLLQRYERPERLAAAHRLAAVPERFDAVPLPTALPESGPALEDWFAVVALAAPIAAAAHRFSVLLPIDVDTDPDEQARMVARARRVVESERPAHTVADVRPYWAAFRLGDARLGIDTQVGRSARAAALVLGSDALATAHLVPGHRRGDLTCGGGR